MLWSLGEAADSGDCCLGDEGETAVGLDMRPGGVQWEMESVAYPPSFLLPLREPASLMGLESTGGPTAGGETGARRGASA